jgi:heme-degrading monooxygenase HmoA
MIIRLWTTRVDPGRMAEYEENERNRSTPMFREQPGCLGALFLRSGEICAALTFWKDMDSVERLTTSRSYLEASAFYSRSGMLLGTPSLEVFEVRGGFFEPQASAEPEAA